MRQTDGTEFQKMVRDFNVAVKAPADKDLRIRLIREEARELYNAIKDHDPIETIDGLCDLLYVTYGAAEVFGIILDTKETSESPPTLKGPDWPKMNFELPDFVSAVNSAVASLEVIHSRFEYMMQAKVELTTLADGLWACATQGMGIDLRPFFREVHRTNMHKLKGPKREDGKQLKPEGWKPPRIAVMYTRVQTFGNPPSCDADCTDPETYDVSLRVPHIDGGYSCGKCGGLFVGVD